MQIELRRPNEKWFFLIILPSAFAIEWVFARTLDWVAYPRSEWIVLVDLCIFVPLVYLAAFLSTLPLKARLLRTSAIAGIGLFGARFIVPDANQFVINDLTALRYAMLGFVLLFEGFVFWKLMQALYRDKADAQSLQRDFAMPGWIAKLLLLEAKFWKAVWGIFKR